MDNATRRLKLKASLVVIGWFDTCVMVRHVTKGVCSHVSLPCFNHTVTGTGKQRAINRVEDVIAGNR